MALLPFLARPWQRRIFLFSLQVQLFMLLLQHNKGYMMKQASIYLKAKGYIK